MSSLLLRRYIPTFVAVGVLAIMMFLLSVAYNTYTQDATQRALVEDEVGKLESKINVIRSNQDLVREEITDYNKVLTQLVPNSEDFFTILYSLEELSKQTGFTVTGYTVNLAKTTRDRYSVSVQGVGDTETFLKFLQNYQFGGGRLITSEKIEYTTVEADNVKILLNFYNQKASTTSQNVIKISDSDLKLMEEIKEKTTVIFTPPDPSDVDGYATKSNPF